MKTLKMLALVVVFTFSGVLSASTEPGKVVTEKGNTVTETISRLLENPPLDLENEAEATVMVTVNMDNELVVLSIEAENQEVASFIRGRLNYKKVDGKVDSKLKAYNVPVRILTE